MPKIYCFDNNQYYNNVTIASRELGIDRSSITRVCTKKANSAGSMRFCFADDIDNFEPAVVKNHKKKVFCLNNQKTYDSAADAARELGIANRWRITDNILKKIKDADGYVFCYDSEKDSFIGKDFRPYKREVYCLETYTVYESAVEAARILGVRTLARVIAACQGKYSNNTVQGYNFCYAENKDNFIPRENGNLRKVYCYELDMEFNSIIEAAEYSGCTAGGISLCCQGVIKYTNFKRWCYLENKETIEWGELKTNITKWHQRISDELSKWVTVENNRRSILPSKRELDIYLPEHHAAIELNGMWWHREEAKGKYFHVEKMDEAASVGIKLINIFDNQINEENFDLWMSCILQKFKINVNKIYARKTEVKVIDNKSAKEFISQNHLQGGFAVGSVCLGLFYENKIVSVMTFGKSRFNSNYEWELIRFCNLAGVSVIGGASKLLKYFESNFNPTSIISYANLQWSDGGLYTTLGFTEIEKSEPSYWWCTRYESIPRYKCQKHKLKKLLNNFDENLTEKQNMENNGFWRVFDCGNAVFVK